MAENTVTVRRPAPLWLRFTSRFGQVIVAFAIASIAFWLFTRNNDFPVGYHPDESKKARFISEDDIAWDFYHPALMLETAIRLLRKGGTGFLVTENVEAWRTAVRTVLLHERVDIVDVLATPLSGTRLRAMGIEPYAPTAARWQRASATGWAPTPVDVRVGADHATGRMLSIRGPIARKAAATIRRRKRRS